MWVGSCGWLTGETRQEALLIKVKSESEWREILFLLFLSLGEVAMNLRKPP